MSNELLMDLFSAIKDGSLYSWIANNYWKISKDELKDIALEYIAWEGRDRDEMIYCLRERWVLDED